MTCPGFLCAGGNRQGSLKMIYKQIVAALKLGQLVSWASSVEYFRLGPDVTVHVLKIGCRPSECQRMRMDGLRSFTINVNAKNDDFVCVC